VEPNIISFEVHPQLKNNGHPVDGALVDVDLLWLCICKKCPNGRTLAIYPFNIVKSFHPKNVFLEILEN
jgi:hypothetical protein